MKGSEGLEFDVTQVAPSGGYPAQPRRTTTVEIHTQAVERVIGWFHEQLGEPLTLQNMADVANLSPYHFSRIFSHVTGISPCKFLAVLRLQHAKQLLLTTSLSVTDVCFEVGYSSLGTFTTQFTQSVGLSPARFRRCSEHPQLSGLEALLAFREHGFPAIPTNVGISGRIDMAVHFTGVIFIGVYTSPIPQNRPSGWAMIREPGYYYIPSVPDGRYWVFSAAFNWSNDPLTYLLPNQHQVYVGAGEAPITVLKGCVIGSTRLVLRRRQPTDPPILSALPILLNQQAVQIEPLLSRCR